MVEQWNNIYETVLTAAGPNEINCEEAKKKYEFKSKQYNSMTLGV